MRGWRVFQGRIGKLASPFNEGSAVIGREQRVLLRHYLEQGMSKAAIARHLRISRRTVYNWIEAGELDRGADDKAVRYRPRAPQPSKLDPFKEIIRTRLADYPELSAVRLFDEVKAAGYPGGYGQVKRYVRAVRPRDPVEPVVRFETPPGHQAQVDFAEFRLPSGKRHALIVVLGYSRQMWLRFYERQTMMVVIRRIEESFPYFGGVPVELLFDQMKAVVIADGPYSPVVPRPEPPETLGRETDERALPNVDVEQRALRTYALGEERTGLRATSSSVLLPQRDP